jgi:hypothetical protein
MGNYRRRSDVSIGPGWALLLVAVVAAVAAAYWIGPGRAAALELELFALRGDSLVTELEVRGFRDPETGELRFLLPLAVHNAGRQAVRPDQVTFSLPGRYRLASARGELPAEVAPGVPLRRYTVALGGPPVRPGQTAWRPPGLHGIWLEPDMPSYYCALVDGRVPEFVPAAGRDPAVVSELRIFYSLEVRATHQRSTGLLTVRFDPAELDLEPAAMPPAFPTTFEEPEVEAPDLGPLRSAGQRTSHCGEADQPVELFTAVWQSAGGARLYVVHVGGAPRKHLYDLNGDGVIDLETWDVDGDGRFDARREARFPVPEFLRPLPPRELALMRPDTVPPDSAWLALFHQPAAGPFRFTRPPPRQLAAPALPDTLVAHRTGPTMADALPPPDTVWLELFHDVQAGPFRFVRRPAAAAPDTAAAAQPPAAEHATEPAAAPPAGAPMEPAAPATPAAAPPAAQPAAPAQPPPATAPPPRRTVPLGTPVPRPPPRPDTIPS